MVAFGFVMTPYRSSYNTIDANGVLGTFLLMDISCVFWVVGA